MRQRNFHLYGSCRTAGELRKGKKAETEKQNKTIQKKQPKMQVAYTANFPLLYFIL